MAIQGLRGSVSFAADGTLARRPENWRETILSLYPNGSAPLTALTALMKSQSTDDPIFHWFEKEFPNQIVAVTGVYSNADLQVGNAWGAGAKAKDAAVWIKMSEADRFQLKVGNILTVSAPASGNIDSNRFQIIVTGASAAGDGASSYVTGKLIKAFTSLVMASYTTAVPSGTSYPEGDTLGAAIAYDPSEISNYTQIFRQSLEVTRTAKKTRLRTGDQVAQAKAEALELHSVGMERGFFFNGPKYIVPTPANGQPQRITAGIPGFITTNRWDFRAAAGVGSTTWAGSAVDAAKNYAWLLTTMEQIFRYGSQEKIGFCGAGVILAIQQLVANLPGTQVVLSPSTMNYGFKVLELSCPFGTLLLKNHPLFTIDPAYRNDMVILDTANIIYRYLDDTKYLPNRQANDLDGEKSEYLTECGLELHHEKSHAILNGLGNAPAS